MKNVSIPDELADRVEASGADLRSFAVKAIEQKLSREATLQVQTLDGLLAGGWQMPTVKGKSRKDGKAWSEIEAATDVA
jgi:hypothetical protein